ncbi:hypothetical protein Enr13x_43410 [Stieleria neptunia]|uniref:Uncharacterized protein n=1 Tax=Stieleria neptunia TaxID=2527979 RepID=A0A518HUE4_9BACT|nr:hypothetical protein [Stieleria neptunia]QDV44475.1 hypothetical protein Enr13x_43410 [Stieleria neptunia]
MNETHEIRFLRIEHLESRSLLAANLFASDEIDFDLFADAADSSSARQNAGDDLTQEVRTFESANRVGLQAFIGPTQPETNSNLTENTSSDLTSQTDAAETLRHGPQARRSPGSDASDATDQSPSSAVDAALVAITETESTETVDDAITSETETESELAQQQLFDLTMVSAIETREQELVSLSLARSVTSDDSIDGLIELSSSSNSVYSMDDLQDDDAPPWTFALPVAPEIQSVIDQASNPSDEVTDAMFTHWFGGTDETIAFDQQLLLIGPSIAADDWFNAQGESMLQLHRSFELITGGKELPLSDAALDALIASLAETAESRLQPVGSTYSFELPRLAYPAIAILTVAVMMARRKHKHPLPVAPPRSRPR